MFNRLVIILTLLGCTASFCQAQVIDTVEAGQEGAVYRVKQTPGSFYHWELPAGGVIVSPDGNSYTMINWGEESGLYALKVVETNLYGCTGDTVVGYIFVKVKTFPAIYGRPQMCEGEQTTLTASAGKPKHEVHDYSWSTGATTQTIVVSPQQDTKYYVIVRFDDDVTDTAYFTLKVKPRPYAAMQLLPTDPEPEEKVSYYYQGSGANSFLWYLDFGNDTSIISRQKNTEYLYNTPGPKTVKLIVFNSDGCADTITTSLFVGEDFYLYAPNAFSPNGDNINDGYQLYVAKHDFRSSTFRIYDRWGKLIFETNNLEKKWDGKYRDEVAPQGIYIYSIDLVTADGIAKQYNGTIALTR